MIRLSITAFWVSVAVAMLVCGCSRFDAQRPEDPNQGWHYKLRSGDTIAKIAEMSGRTKKEIAYANGFGNPALIEPGRYIWIPPRQGASVQSQYPRLRAPQNYKRFPNSKPVAPTGSPVPLKNSSNGQKNNGYKKPKRASDADKKAFRWPIDMSRATIHRR